MVHFSKGTNGNSSIVIDVPGDREDYIALFRTLTSMVGRIDKDKPLDYDERYYFSMLLEQMIPSAEQLCVKK